MSDQPQVAEVAALTPPQLQAMETQIIEMIRAQARGEALRSQILASGNPLGLPLRGATVQPLYDMLVTVAVAAAKLEGGE